MSVIGSKRVIFCEGKRSSLDFRLLNKIVDDLPSAPTIVPSGGKFTFSVFAQGYFYPDEVHGKQYLVFRDRDFDEKPTDSVQLLQLAEKENITLTHRACVENYCIDAHLIHEYWQTKFKEKQENPASKWTHRDSPGLKKITIWIEDSAKSIRDYQAVRWALSDLSRIGAARGHLKPTWTKGSGNLPDSLKLKDCQSKAIELIERFKQSSEKITIDGFNSSLKTNRERFAQTEFWEQKQYLICFHGKDLQKAMQKHKPHYISLEKFFNWAVTQIDIAQHPDLVELRKRIKKL